jgi:hypothetical protein
MGRALEIVATLFAVIAVAWIVIAQRIGIWRGLQEGREAKGQTVLSTARFDRLTVLARWRLRFRRCSQDSKPGLVTDASGQF